MSASTDMEKLNVVSGCTIEKGRILIETMCHLLTSKNSLICENAVKYLGGIMSSPNDKITEKCYLSGFLKNIEGVM